MTKTKYPKQNKADIKAMGAWYGERYSIVWLVHCLNCERVVGVEVAPANPNEQADGRNSAVHTYQDLLLARRERVDRDPNGQPMRGYECVCGNNTKLSKAEQGVIQEVTGKTYAIGGKAVADPDQRPIRSLSPFEQSQVEAEVRIRAASTKPDVEFDGTKERYESFMLERVK